jgi:hypothetical protein
MGQLKPNSARELESSHVVLNLGCRRSCERHDRNLGKIAAKVAELGVLGPAFVDSRQQNRAGDATGRQVGGPTGSRDPTR